MQNVDGAMDAAILDGAEPVEAAGSPPVPGLFQRIADVMKREMQLFTCRHDMAFDDGTDEFVCRKCASRSSPIR